MIVGYARVSTNAQADGEALDQQIARLKAAGAEDIFVDVESGRSDRRAQFKKLLTLVETGNVKQLIITRIDRLGRSVISLHKAVKLIEENGVKLRVLDAPVDPNSPFGWFSISQMSSLAEFESRLMSSRIRHGKDYARSQGKSLSHAFGYTKDSQGQSVPSLKLLPCGLTEWEVAERSIAIYQENGNLRLSVSEIFKLYGKKFSIPGFRDWMRNPILRGHTVYGRWGNLNNPSVWDVRWNTHEALITEAEYKQIEHQIELARLKFWGEGKKSREDAMKYPLAGQVYCGVCGARCFRNKRRNGEYFMRCRRRNEGAHNCSNKPDYLYRMIESAVVQKLLKKSEDLTTIANISIGRHEPPQLLELRSQLEGLLALGNNPAILAATEQIKLQIREWETKVFSPQKERFRTILINSFSNSSYWSTLPDEMKQMTLKHLVYKVVLKDGLVFDITLLI